MALACEDIQILNYNPSQFPSLMKTMCGASFSLFDIRADAIHSGNTQCNFFVVYPDTSSENIVLQYPSQPNYLSHGYVITLLMADATAQTAQIRVGTDATQGCIALNQGTLQDTRACCSPGVKDSATGVCKDPAALVCSDIPIDSWKVAKTSVPKGESLPFIMRTEGRDYDFEIKRVETLADVTVIRGKTDAFGCYKGVIPAQAEGTYEFFVCYPNLISTGCAKNFGRTSITWGTPPISTWTILIIIIALIAIFYIYMNKKKK